MGYLSILDYKRLIQQDNLQQIISEDDSIRTDSELAAQEEIISYLTQKYDVDQEFIDTTIFNLSSTYYGGQTLILSASTYSPLTTYSTNDLVALSGSVYYTSGTTTNELPTTASTWSNIGLINSKINTIIPTDRYTNGVVYNVGDQIYWKNKVYTCNLSNSNIFPDDVQLGSQYWGLGVVYTVSATTLPTNLTYYAVGDARSQQMVNYMIDITLYHIHSRVAPRNIPDIRVKRYDDAIKWLKMCLMGDITPNLLLKTPRSGTRIRIGSNPKNQNNY